ncbi:hypothetical protein HOK021_47680 [Streptomyces hygroscopicus]|nr:hypothetical protein HOK021_47680 [Streptomyces hygroscopicus]
MVNLPMRADDLTGWVSRAHVRVGELLNGLGDEERVRDSALPGWSRGHVVQHLTDNARAFERQARFALNGHVVLGRQLIAPQQHIDVGVLAECVPHGEFDRMAARNPPGNTNRNP